MNLGEMIRQARETTGASISDCKRACEESGGDLPKALASLRAKGLAKAEKRMGRATAEGRVAFGLTPDGKKAALVELQCETDFVAKGDDFQGLLKETVGLLQALPPDRATPAAIPADTIKARIGKLGENIAVPRCLRWDAGSAGRIGVYLHANGKLAALVEVRAGDDAAAAAPDAADLLRDLCLQVAGMSPRYVAASEFAKDVVAAETAKYAAEVQGKPPQIAEKILAGKLDKNLYSVVGGALLSQPFLNEAKFKGSVAQLVEAASKKAGKPFQVVRFVRYEVGAD